MAHLTINPDSASAWVVILKEGETTIGRADDNDVRIEEGGISSHHCRITLNQGNVSIVDLNSTNGTSINGSRVTQAAWSPGQVIHLGNLPVRLEGSQPTPAASPVAAAPAPPIRVAMPLPAPAPAEKAPVRLRISTGNHATTAPAVAEDPVAEVPPPIVHSSAMSAPAGTRCRSHSKSPARWHCAKCRKFFCDLCVAARATHSGASHLCRTCGGECVPVQVGQAADTGERGFFARLPGAFIYPFRGFGVLVLLVATVVFAALSAVSGIFSILMTMVAIGYTFLYMQNIIYCTAADDNEMPGMPEFDGLFSAFFTMAGTVAFCFILPIGLGIAKLSGVDIPTSALVSTMILGCLYFPMAFLAVAMNDSVAAVNPILVIPSILKVPWHYLVTTILLSGVFGVRLLGDALMSGAADVGFTTRDMSVLLLTFAMRAFWSFVSVYLLTVGIRILGLLYVTQKEKLGWF